MRLKGTLPKLAYGIVLTSFLTAAHAQQSEKNQGAYVSGFADYFFAHWHPEHSSGKNIGESLGLGVDVGYRFNSQFAARVELAKLNLAYERTSDSESGIRYGVDGLYHIGNSGFYVLAGIKRVDVLDAFTAGNVGFGGYLEVAPNWAVNAEALFLKSFDDNKENDAALKLGVSYSFGQTKTNSIASVAPAPVPMLSALDSDGDGIVDSQDECSNTPSKEAVDGTGCTVFETIESIHKIEIFFAHDNATIAPQYFEDVAALHSFLKDNNLTVNIIGHTSSIGSDEYNLALSNKRAEAVKQMLINQYNIDSTRITVDGKGERELVNKAATNDAHAQNRRAEATIKHTEKVKKYL